MSFEDFYQAINTDIFDYQLIAGYFRDLKKIRDKVASLVKEGKIIRIKKGLYVFGDRWRRAPLSLEMIANLVYGPSCVSFEFALSHYGCIAERAETITSLTIGDSKKFHTPFGVFEYRAIDRKKFKIGIEYRNIEKDGGYFIASREKALLDLVYRTPHIRTLDQLRHFLFEEMRMDESMFRALDIEKLEQMAEVYNKNSVFLLRNV